jgi:energy-coupling factor transporter ATP-binding protein EcfA2
LSLNSKRVAVDKIYFGDIDARSEITSRDPEKRSRFVDAFSVPASLNFNQVLNGERFLIVGPKGSGKTAFLRYLDQHLERTTDGKSRFIIFRDDVTDQDRTKLVSLSDFRYYDSNGEDNSAEIDPLDCLNAWQLFIHREIAYIVKNSNALVGMTPEIGTYIEIVNKVFSSFTTSGFKQILQKINKGKLKLWGPGVGLEAELEFFDKHGNVDVSELVRYCNHVASRFCFNQQKTKSRINIFFDEVNINFVSGRAFKRNAVLVRDLVAACAKMNALFAENQVPVYVYTALRSEVVDSVEGSVRELQKLVDDKAVHINWVVSTGNHDDQPLIQLLRKRIFTSVRVLVWCSSNDFKFLIIFLNPSSKVSVSLVRTLYI